MPSKIKKPSRRNHYVGQHYIGRFANKNGVLCAHYGPEDKILKDIAPVDLAVKKDLYTLKENGRVDDSYETIFANIEGGLCQSLDLIISDIDSFPQSDRIKLSAYIAFMYARNPKLHESKECMLEDAVGQLWEIVKQLEEVHGLEATKSKEIEECLRIKGSSGYFMSKEEYLNQIPEIARNCIPFIAERPWTLLKAASNVKNNFFICSDCPVCHVPSLEASGWRGLAPGSPEADIFFPIDSKHALYMSAQGPRDYILKMVVDSHDVLEINKVIMWGAYRMIYARNSRVLSKVLAQRRFE